MDNKENSVLKYVTIAKMYQTLLLMKYTTRSDNNDKDAAVMELIGLNNDLMGLMKVIGESLD